MDAYVDPEGVQHGFLVTPMPEPGTISLITGAIGLLVFKRRDEMNAVIIVSAATGLLTLLITAATAPQFTAIDRPGAAFTKPLGINNRGEMVGSTRGQQKPAARRPSQITSFVRNVDDRGLTLTTA